jgi:hypothetical protein
MPTSVWLRPEARVSVWLDEAIADIARVVGHVPFGAHLTVATGTQALDDKGMRELAGKAAPLALSPSGLLQTERFTQTFAVTFERTMQLDRLRTDTLEALGASDEALFIPHVSLIYGRAEVAALLEAAAARLNGPIVFDRIVAVEAPQRNVSQADVAQWRVGPEYQLG